MGRKTAEVDQALLQQKKKDYFIRIAEKRVGRAIESIRALYGLTKESTYSYTDEQADAIVAALYSEIEELEQVLQTRGECRRFKLDKDEKGEK